MPSGGCWLSGKKGLFPPLGICALEVQQRGRGTHSEGPAGFPPASLTLKWSAEGGLRLEEERAQRPKSPSGQWSPV